jgi:hypothetical protein
MLRLLLTFIIFDMFVPRRRQLPTTPNAPVFL